MINAYLTMLPTLLAEDQLRAIQASDAPHMKKSDRHQMLSPYHRAIGMAVRAKRATKRAMEGMGVRVKHV